MQLAASTAATSEECMSCRGVKRVLGETSPERKCRLLFGVCLLALITGSFFWYNGKIETQVRQANRRLGQGLVDAVLLRHHWSKLENDEQSQLIAQKMGDELKNQVYTWSFIRRKSSGEGAPTDEFETRLLEEFSSNPATAANLGPLEVEFADRTVPEKGEYQYYQAVRAKTQCIQCHLSLGALRGNRLSTLDEGDLMSIVKISVPDGETQKALNENRAILLATALVTTFLAMVAYVFVRYLIVKPVIADVDPLEVM
jgi:hypothetical protein